MTNTTITLIGNVGSDPEHRVLENGSSLTKFRLAATDRRFDRDTRTWTDVHTSWYSISVFRELADHAFRSLSSGDRVIVVGTLKIRKWQNGDRQGTEVDVEAVAVGPDLRWGTTSFTRSKPASRDADDAASDVAEDAWGSAGGDDGAGFDASPRIESADDRRASTVRVDEAVDAPF